MRGRTERFRVMEPAGAGGPAPRATGTANVTAIHAAPGRAQAAATATLVPPRLGDGAGGAPVTVAAPAPATSRPQRPPPKRAALARLKGYEGAVLLGVRQLHHGAQRHLPEVDTCGSTSGCS